MVDLKRSVTSAAFLIFLRLFLVFHFSRPDIYRRDALKRDWNWRRDVSLHFKTVSLINFAATLKSLFSSCCRKSATRPSVKQRLTAAAWRVDGDSSSSAPPPIDGQTGKHLHTHICDRVYPSVRWDDTHVVLQRFEGEFPNDAENSAPTAKWSSMAEKFSSTMSKGGGGRVLSLTL